MDKLLGQLLEFSMPARPLADALESYVALGFASLPVGDIVPSPYAAVADGGVALGLHDAELDELMPTFVRPDLKTHVRVLRRCGVEFEHLDVAEERFNRATFRDPSGLPVALIEARTFSHGEPNPNVVPICGRFAELSVATHSLDDSVAFWTSLGLSVAAGGDDPFPHRRLQGQGLRLGLYETARFTPALTFHADNVEGRVEFLRAKGFTVRRGSPLDAGGASATLIAPGGIAFFLLPAADDNDSPV